MRLTSTATATDEARTYRAMIAWHDGDKYALDQVLEEVMADPTGVPGLLFVLLDIAVDVSATLDPNVRARLQDALLRIEQDGQA